MVQQMSELENVMPLLSCNFLPVVSRGTASVRFSSRDRKVGFQRCGPLGWENPQLDPWSPNWVFTVICWRSREKILVKVFIYTFNLKERMWFH